MFCKKASGARNMGEEAGQAVEHAPYLSLTICDLPLRRLPGHCINAWEPELESRGMGLISVLAT